MADFQFLQNYEEFGYMVVWVTKKEGRMMVTDGPIAGIRGMAIDDGNLSEHTHE